MNALIILSALFISIVALLKESIKLIKELYVEDRWKQQFAFYSTDKHLL